MISVEVQNCITKCASILSTQPTVADIDEETKRVRTKTLESSWLHTNLIVRNQTETQLGKKIFDYHGQITFSCEVNMSSIRTTDKHTMSYANVTTEVDMLHEDY